jgi:hypothetical protein
MQAEGIFRINGENSQEEYVRDQLNRGVIPEGVDMHCLAGLIKVRHCYLFMTDLLLFIPFFFLSLLILELRICMH